MLSRLWTDAAPFRRRYEKSAAALLAIRSVIERKRPLAGRDAEALALLDGLEAATPHGFGLVWREPSSQWWIVLAWHLVGACLHPDEPSPEASAHSAALGVRSASDALVRHVDELQRIALGVALIDRSTCSFERPLDAQLPFALPGTGFVLTGAADARILGVHAGALEVETPSGRSRVRPEEKALPVGGVISEPSARAICADYTLVLEPAALDLPGVSIAAPLRDLPRSFQHEQAPRVSAALELIRRHQPASFTQLRAMMRVAAMKPRSVGEYSNVSQSDLPGAFVCTATADPYVLADSIVHELHHNRLFFLQDEAPLFAGERDGIAEAGAFYSPWRDDLRPLQGLFHGAFVYLPVLRFWIDVVRAGAVLDDRRSYALDQLARIPVQCAVAIMQLRRHARLTARGDAVLAEMAAELDHASADARALGAPVDAAATIFHDDGSFTRETSDATPISVRDSLLAHWHRHDVRHQLSADDLLGAK